MPSNETHSAGQASDPYTLYHNFWSSCSLMLRLSLFLSKNAGSGEPIVIKETEIDIQHGGQIDENFMCNINPRGQVPALANPSKLPHALCDSLDITIFLFQFYPNMCPPQHAYYINKYLRELHSINLFTLSFWDNQRRGESLFEATLKPLADPNITPKFREALEAKIQFMASVGETAFLPQMLLAEEKKASFLLQEIGKIHEQYKSAETPWLFGTDVATALDAHLLIICARLKDVGRWGLVGDTIKKYCENVFQSAEWKTFMNGRTTMYEY